MAKPIRVELPKDNDQFQSVIRKPINFAGKVVGSNFENPHSFSRAGFNSIAFPETTASGVTVWTENSDTTYKEVSLRNGVAYVAGASTAANSYRQFLVKFDLLAEAKNLNGSEKNISAGTLRQLMLPFTVTFNGFGVGANAGAAANGLTVKILNRTTGAWDAFGSNTASSLTDITGTVTNFTDYIGNDGIMYFNMHSTYPSDGTNTSTMSVDFIQGDFMMYATFVSVRPESFPSHVSLEGTAAATESAALAFDVSRIAWIANNGAVDLIVNFDDSTSAPNKITVPAGKVTPPLERRAKFATVKAASGTCNYSIVGLR